MASGHPDARRYPLAIVWSEARIVRQREAMKAKQDAVVMQSVVGSLFSKEGVEELSKLLKKLDDVG